MLWLIIGAESHQIISCNAYHGETKSQLWVARPNGKNLKVMESKDAQAVKEAKEAIDFAIESGYKTFTIE